MRRTEEITSYLHDEENRYVPQEDREVWFDSWYDDYSDQDETYGKQEERIGSGTHSGRYMSSQTIDRMAYAPQRNTNAYKALILDRSTTLTIATEEYERVQGADPGSEHDADDRKDGERRRDPGRDVYIYDRGRNAGGRRGEVSGGV